MPLYDMGRRITELVNRRNIALTWLHRATPSTQVNNAIRALEDEPNAGLSGGPSRDARDHGSVQGLRSDGPLAVNGDTRTKKERVRSNQPLTSADAKLRDTKTGVTEREGDVIKLVALGLSNPEVAKSLFMSLNTVKTHVSHVLVRHHLQNRTQLANFARDRGIV